MSAHVTTTYFPADAKVGLYSILKRPIARGYAVPLAEARVPEGGQVTFKVEEPGVAYWLAGEGLDGWRCVAAHSKPGEPVDVAAALERTRPEDPPDLAERRVIGSRGTEHRRGRKRTK